MEREQREAQRTAGLLHDAHQLWHRDVRVGEIPAAGLLRPQQADRKASPRDEVVQIGQHSAIIISDKLI